MGSAKAKKCYQSTYGWIDPKGNFYECPFGAHRLKAAELIMELGLVKKYLQYDQALTSEDEVIIGELTTDFLLAEGWGMRHNPMYGKPYLRCNNVNVDIQKTHEEITFYFKYRR